MSRPFRVLVVEDDAGDALLIKRAFIKSGLDVPVTFVDGGQQAIDYLSRKPPFGRLSSQPLPTLLLLDLHMPGVDGFDVLRWLRRHSKMRDMFVVVFSSSEEPEDARAAYELGADSYVVKPPDAEEFMEAVHEMERYWLRLNATPECGSVLL